MLSDNPREAQVPEYTPLTLALARPNPGLWIRAHLMDVKEDYPYHMWRLYRDHTISMRRKPCSYGTFRRYVNILKSARLILPGKREPSSTPFVGYKQFYTLNTNRVNDPRWRHVQYSTDGGMS